MLNRRDMGFIDGSNFVRQLAKKLDVRDLRSDKPPLPSVMGLAKRLFSGGPFFQGGHIRVRTYWFGSYVGSDETFDNYSSQVRDAGFEPRLFKQYSDGREKGVDLGLAKDVLVNAFHHNFDRAVLVAGDADYVELVFEAKRYGAVIDGEFFADGVSPRLRIAFEHFEVLDKRLNPEEWDDLARRVGEEVHAARNEG